MHETAHRPAPDYASVACALGVVIFRSGIEMGIYLTPLVHGRRPRGRPGIM